MIIQDYKGVMGLRYAFQGRSYVLCNIDYEGETPEEYSRNRDGGWCGLSVIDVDASPIKEGIYPIQTMFFDWDEKHERMYPTDVEAWDDSCGYDLENEELVHFNEGT